ncbi:MAG: discoidin domain-containing protein [PVC group bacterium]
MTSRFTTFDRVAALLIAILGIVLFLVWARFPEYKSFAQGDPYLDANQYIPGKNFAARGFLREYLLADYASGPEECYPLWYTHNPPLSEILSGLYHRFGLREISQQRIIAIFWNLIGAGFFYLLLKQLASPRTALFSLAIFISNPLYIAWGDNLFTNHQWAFAFASMYFFLRSIDAAKSPENGNICDDRTEPGNGAQCPSFTNRLSGLKTPPTDTNPGFPNPDIFLGLAALFFFLLCYSNYEYVPFAAIFFIGVRLLKIRRTPWSRIILLMGAGLAAVIIHQLCVIRAVGVSYWLMDKTESLLHRTGMGVTSLMDLYRTAPLLMWEEQARLHGSYTLSSYWQGFFVHLENLFGLGWSAVFIAACVFARYLLPGDAADRKKLLRAVILFFAISVFWFIAFVQHTADHQWGSTVLLFGPFAAFLYGAVLDGLYVNFVRQNNRVWKVIGLIVTAALLAGLIRGRVRNYRPFQAYPGIAALKKYPGKIFITSSIPTLVSTYTGMPAGWLGSNHSALMFSRSRYLVNPRCPLPLEPEFFFSPRHPEDPAFAQRIDAWLGDRFEIEEKGVDFTIYNLKRPLGEPDLDAVDRQRYQEIRYELPRAVAARLQARGQSLHRGRPPRSLRSEPGIAERIARRLSGGAGKPDDAAKRKKTAPVPVEPVSGNIFALPLRIEASSFNSPNEPVWNLCRPNPGSYWHVSLEKVGQAAWVTVDLGEDRAAAVNFIRTRPRPDIRKQYFKTAVIQGSRDGESWEDIAAVIEDEVPSSADWRGWAFENATPYRFYRFFIIDGHEENGAFYSLGALEMYRVEEAGK